MELARDRMVFQPQERREPGQTAKQEGSFRLHYNMKDKLNKTASAYKVR